MAAVLATPISLIELVPGSAIRIQGVSWEGYLALLQELGDTRHSRVAYDRGVLELRMPGQPHEAVNRVLAAIVMTLADEFELEFNDLGSMTLNRPDLDKGVEPDSCFYIQNAVAGQGLSEMIGMDLPPDLALEVDIASSSQGKMEIYRAMRVPEVWIYQLEKLTIKHLQGEEYKDSPISRAFPSVGVEQLNEWVQLRKQGTDLTVVRAVRKFCRTIQLE